MFFIQFPPSLAPPRRKQIVIDPPPVTIYPNNYTIVVDQVVDIGGAQSMHRHRQRVDQLPARLTEGVDLSAGEGVPAAALPPSDMSGQGRC